MKGQKDFDSIADVYDLVELHGKSDTPIVNRLIADTLKSHGAVSVLDISCGTGAQVIGLSQAGFQVTGVDLSKGMLEVAKAKAAKAGVSAKFQIGDMCTWEHGSFDAVLSMHNSIGLLTRDQFRVALHNARTLLKDGGLYMCDIYNRAIMQFVPRHEVLDTAREQGPTKCARFTTGLFDADTGVLHVSQETCISRTPGDSYQRITEAWELQTYTGDELKALLVECGFSSATVTLNGMPDLLARPGASLFVMAKV